MTTESKAPALDLRNALPGDVLQTRSGDEVPHLGRSDSKFHPPTVYPHHTVMPGHFPGMVVTDDGRFDINKMGHRYDIVRNLSAERRELRVMHNNWRGWYKTSTAVRPIEVLRTGATAWDVLGEDAEFNLHPDCYRVQPSPVPVDHLADVKAAWNAGKRVRLSAAGSDALAKAPGAWNAKAERPHAFAWDGLREWYEIEPDAPADPYAHLRQALRESKTIEWWDDKLRVWKPCVGFGPDGAWDNSPGSTPDRYRVTPTPALIDPAKVVWPKAEPFAYETYRAGYADALRDCKAAVEKARSES